MDRSEVMTLVAKTYTADSIGQFTAAETTRDVFCNIRSVTRAEWLAAGQQGLKPELMATMFSPDYEGEEIAEINDVRYSVYRVYRRSNDLLELYLERKAGNA